MGSKMLWGKGTERKRLFWKGPWSVSRDSAIKIALSVSSAPDVLQLIGHRINF